MAEQIDIKQTVLNEQRKEYQSLFEAVPCLITVQNKNFELLQYNREFSEMFHPAKGDLCYHAYKRRSAPCEQCPVVETFKDGKPHHGEQKGINKHGELSYWALRTAPIRNREGVITAVMEISVDITQIRLLEKEVRKSEEKYRAIFNNIPNPLFVLNKDDLTIIDCNSSVRAVYGFTKNEILNQSFEVFFDPEIRTGCVEKIKACRSINTVRQVGKQGKIIFADIHVSPSEYLDSQVLLVNATDVTKRLIAEQQLIQAGKMATLGEMATGIAHELNQPLSVIKSASNYIMRKIKADEAVPKEIMVTMAEEMDGQVDRASKIINHMREFGRKSDVTREKAQVNTALIKAFDIFRQQLKLRQIEVIQHLDPDLPLIMADENRLEQVFINLLINARDAIEEKMEKRMEKQPENREIKKQIFLITRAEDDQVVV
jgi:histidine kinase